MSAFENAMDRIEKSFYLYKKWFINLSIPMLIYNVWGLIILPYLLVLLLFPFFWSIYSLFMNNFNWWFVLTLIFPIIFIIFFYIFFYIAVFITTIKSISFYYNNEGNLDNYSIFTELKQSKSYLWSIMKTYWYIFAYVALIPSLIFIAWWILFNLGYFLGWVEILTIIWAIFMWIAATIFIVFAIYRWIKTSFALFHAISNNDYSKDNFSEAVKYSNNNWWKIFLNSLLIGLIIGLSSGVILNFVYLIVPGSSEMFLEDIFVWNFDLMAWFWFLISSLFEWFINTIAWVFMTIFLFILYKQIQWDKSEIKEEIINKDSEVKNEL